MKAIRCKTPSRIAINLYDMEGGLGRVDGGMGFFLKYPSLVFRARQSGEITIKGEISQEIKLSILEAVDRLKESYGLGGIELNIKKNIPEHRGFGSKTSTLLSIGHVYTSLYGEKTDFRELGQLLGRGATSGLGINLIDKGGFILEGGHSTKTKKGFSPSSATKNPHPAPMLARYDMPDWDILIAVPYLDRAFGKIEIEFFNKTCPIKAESVERVARITLSQVLPAVAENDLRAFCKGINSIQKEEWKRCEIERYGSKIKDFMSYLRNKGALGVGMSSMGPCVYAFGNDISSIFDAVKKYEELDMESVFLTKPDNVGILTGEN